MRQAFPFVIALAAIALTVSFGCNKSKIDPNDSSPPTVQIKVKNSSGQYEVATKTATLGDRLDLTCVVSDPQGVKSLDLTFSETPANECTVGSTLNNGSFWIPLPANQSQTLQGDSSGNVIDTLPMFATINGATCTVNNQTGVPHGFVITVTCKGTNWSSNSQNNSATAKLTVE